MSASIPGAGLGILWYKCELRQEQRSGFYELVIAEEIVAPGEPHG